MDQDTDDFGDLSVPENMTKFLYSIYLPDRDVPPPKPLEDRADCDYDSSDGESVEDDGESVEDEEEQQRRIQEEYAPRLQTFEKLPREYLPTDDNPNPPLLNFGIPCKRTDLYKYATWAGIQIGIPLDPTIPSPFALFQSVNVLRETTLYPFELAFPFKHFKDAECIVTFFTNKNWREKQLKLEVRARVLKLLLAELELDENLKPRWYFDSEDPWRPERRRRPKRDDEAATDKANEADAGDVEEQHNGPEGQS